MWQYNAINMYWRYISGSQVTSAFTVGLNIEDPQNYPCSRYFPNLGPIKSLNSLLLTGGLAIVGGISDTWRFNATSEQWAWIHGSYNTSVSAVYGQIGYPDPSNIPGSRFATATAIADGTEKLFLFSGTNNVGDTWMFDHSIRQWACIYVGTTTGTSQMPGGRLYHSMIAVPGTSLIVMTNGNGYGNLGKQNQLSDIWILDTYSVTWVWVRGEEATNVGTYGTKRVTSQQGLPPRRNAPSLAYAAGIGKLIMYAGSLGAGITDDLWYIDFGLPKPTVSTTSALQTSTTSISFANSITVTRVSTSLPTASPTGNTNTQLFMDPLTFGIIAVVVLMIMLISLSCCLWRMIVFLRQKHHEKSRFESSTESTVTSGATMLNDQTAMALPGFLKYRAGSEFRWHKRIAKGGGGEVFLGDALIPQLAVFGETIIVKIVAPDRTFVDQRNSDAFDQEVSVMYSLGHHENIAGILGWCDQPLAMLMKFYVKGALNGFLTENSDVSKIIKVSFLVDISHGLQFMHSKSVAHCDIKPANVLVDEDAGGCLFCALTDFGIARLYTDGTQLVQAFKIVNLRGLSIAYAAPEALKNFRAKVDATKEEAFAGDVYSFSVVTSFLLVGELQWYQ